MGAYAPLQRKIENFDDYLASIRKCAASAKKMGFRAVKLETTFSGPYANMGLNEKDERMTEVIFAVRREVVPDFSLMVDVQYTFDSLERAQRTLTSWIDFNVFFVKTPLWTDDLDDYRALAESVPIRIAAGEWLTTHYEFEDLVNRGGVAVVQPDIGRVGSLSEALKVTQFAA